MQLTRQARDQWKKMSSTGFIDFSNHDTSNIPNLSNPSVNLGLAYQTTCDDMFSDLELHHIYFTFFGYVPGL